MRILLVEDDPRIVLFVGESLEDAGYSVTVVRDGEDGFLDARLNDHDLVVLDLLLPRLDGFEVARRLRAAGRAMPILMLTARDREADKIAGLDVGADDYLTKPFRNRRPLRDAANPHRARGRLHPARAGDPLAARRRCPITPRRREKVAHNGHHHASTLDPGPGSACGRRRRTAAPGPPRPPHAPPGPVARIVAGDLSALLLGAPAAYALAGYALRPAKEALEREERFTVAASHELRTPMTVLLGMLEAALLRRRTPEQYEDALRRATAEAVHVSDLLDEVLTLAHVESGVDTPFSVLVDLRAIAHAAAAEARPVAEDKGQMLHATLDGPLPVRGNARLLRRALDSLLDNALIHTPSSGAIHLTARRAGGRAALTIRDTGPGIAPEHLPHLFEPFYRVDPTRTSVGDTQHAGLGLSRAARIARAHDGRLTIESRVGRGSAFTLSLPLDRERPGAAPAAGTPDAPAARLLKGAHMVRLSQVYAASLAWSIQRSMAPSTLSK